MPRDYDVAQICLNGHVVNDFSKKYPERNKRFCDKCGAATITNCSTCKAEIQGGYFVSGASILTNYTSPSYCSNCGKPFPWTEAKIKTFKELIDEHSNLAPQEKENIKKDIYDIAKETPRSPLAITRFKKLGKKIGEEGRKLVVDIASETAIKLLKDGFKY